MNTIGVVATVEGSDINLYFLEMLNGILQGASYHRQNTTVFSVSNWRAEEATVLQYCDGRVDGLIFIAPDFDADFLESFSSHTPAVTIHADSGTGSAWNIDIDNEGGAYLAVRHLIDLGHTRIAHISGRPGRADTERRLCGYRRALADCGIELDPGLIFESYYTIEAGRDAVDRMIAQLPPKRLPTAVFCGNDAIASGCVEQLQQLLISVPADISVVGFDDLLLAEMTRPPLTTVRQPFRQMGHRAVDMLIDRVRAPQEEEAAGAPAGSEIFETQLVMRRSTAPPASSH